MCFLDYINLLYLISIPAVLCYFSSYILRHYSFGSVAELYPAFRFNGCRGERENFKSQRLAPEMLGQSLMYDVEATPIQLPFLTDSQGIEHWENKVGSISCRIKMLTHDSGWPGSHFLEG